MQEFLLLFRGGDTERQTLSPEQIQAHMQRWQEWIGGLAQQERFIAGQPLTSAGKVLSGTDQKLTDGPFIEGKEIIGGYVQVWAADFDEAVQIARGCPNLEAESGTVEIRQIGDMNAA
jgi:hypothetical protein